MVHRKSNLSQNRLLFRLFTSAMKVCHLKRSGCLLVLAWAFAAGQAGFEVVAVHAGDEVEADLLRADRRALADHSAASKIKVVHRLNHPKNAAIFLGLALRQ